MKSIFDPEFKYTRVEDQGEHYLQEKFARIRRELEQEQSQQQPPTERKERNG